MTQSKTHIVTTIAIGFQIRFPIVQQEGCTRVDTLRATIHACHDTPKRGCCRHAHGHIRVDWHRHGLTWLHRLTIEGNGNAAIRESSFNKVATSVG